MNALSRQGKALPSEVRNQIIEKCLSNEDIAKLIYRDNQTYPTKPSVICGSQGSNSSPIFASYFGILVQFIYSVLPEL